MNVPEVSTRLQRLQRLTMAALSAQGCVLRAGAVGASRAADRDAGASAAAAVSDADAAVEGAAVRAAALALIAAVEGLLDLCAEVKLDAALIALR